MTESTDAGSQRAPKPTAEGEQGDEQAQRRQPAFGAEEAEAVAEAQDQAVEQGLLPPSQDEAGPGPD